MQQSGKKLVLALTALAMVAGVLSWWYQFNSSHRTTRFWGPQLASLIARPSHVEVREVASGEPLSWKALESGRADSAIDLSQARGMVHLRHALMSDRNYQWGRQVDGTAVPWRWCLHWSDETAHGVVLLSADFAVLGKVQPSKKHVDAISCQPMAESLRQYFQEQGLLGASKP